MLSYPYQKDQIITPTKALLLGLLCTVWLLVGLIGHDPWKPDEAYSFGLVYHMLKSGDWLVPTLAGDDFLEKPPLFYWTAALFAKLTTGYLPLHDGARLASGFYMALTLLFMAAAGRELFGKSAGWAAVIILIGNLGLMIRAHLMVTDLALLTGCAMLLYGYSLVFRREVLAGLIIGTGIGIGFMSKGFIALVFLLLIGGTLLAFREWRSRAHYIALAVAGVSLLPWLLIWPLLLFQRSPALFWEWAWQLNIGRWTQYVAGGSYPDTFFYVTLLPWYAWPAFPLAAWAVWEARKKVLRSTEFQLLIVGFVAMLVALSLAPRINDLNALPMLLPLSLMASAALFTLKRGAANALDWFGIMTFALIAILLWWGWTGLLVDSPAHITQLLKDYRPGFEPIFQRNQFWMAAILTVGWMMLVWRVGRSIRRSVINWAAGATLLWVLVVTLWMPWLDNAKSYRSMVMSLKKALPTHYNCVSGEQVGESQRAMLQYFANVVVREQARPECELKLVQKNDGSGYTENQRQWEKLWEGGRPGDKGERYWLFKRKSRS